MCQWKNTRLQNVFFFLQKKAIARTTTITTVTASTATTTTAYGFQHCTTTKQNNNDNNKTEIQLPDLFSMVPFLRRHPPWQTYIYKGVKVRLAHACFISTEDFPLEIDCGHHICKSTSIKRKMCQWKNTRLQNDFAKALPQLQLSLLLLLLLLAYEFQHCTRTKQKTITTTKLKYN